VYNTKEHRELYANEYMRKTLKELVSKIKFLSFFESIET